jgi:hypothetical protein
VVQGERFGRFHEHAEENLLDSRATILNDWLRPVSCLSVKAIHRGHVKQVSGGVQGGGGELRLRQKAS